MRKWSLFDALDPYRIGYDSLLGFWNSLYGFPRNGTRDWTHGNAVSYSASDDAILVSLRHQDAVIKMKRWTGELLWILGNHGGWRAPWNRSLLEPSEELRWPYHQHAPSETPDGTLLVFDNGNKRARPFQPHLSTADSYSRAVEYRVDPARGLVSQVWSYGGPGDEIFYSAAVGSAYPLTATGNVLVTDGARITDADGKPTENATDARRWARIVEVTRHRPARKVFELIVGDDAAPSPYGWSIYRARRLDRGSITGLP
jgi:hypothetical protein